ncbi:MULTISPECIES: hypothetical protein [Burkholderia]|uniref:Uncharacterized protein n=1 Tax=Burkholderia pyrrocinia TaxID=60550 RepID=A0A318IQI6_BURPY|nr:MULTISPECIES: hypothetical protein [Burkholderia]PXX35448.1 hypothetical protein NA66_100688 [Burkholderia pyrrocinia]SFW41795.1 hypothetical protein SAMN03159384_01911 [Burkholderia sp. NFACC33-1]SFX71135.1 hypothetical protein SAMN03159408_01993 [Burkholderia sp. NFPP32]
MTPVDQARRLRRTVAELARCRIEDVESVWTMLSVAERERLRPLLAEASRAITGHAVPLATAPDDAEARMRADRLTDALAVLPVELSARIAAGLGDLERDGVFIRLTEARRQALAGHAAKHAGFRLSPRAADALRDAALAAAATDRAAPSAPVPGLSPLRVRLRNWLGRHR